MTQDSIDIEDQSPSNDQGRHNSKDVILSYDVNKYDMAYLELLSK